MSWWESVVRALVVIVSSAVAVPSLRGVIVQQRLRAGSAVVSVRATGPGVAGRWHVHRARRDGDAVVLRPLTVHESAPGTVLLALAASGRPVQGRDRWRVLSAAREVVAGQASTGPIEVAGDQRSLSWLRQQLPAEQAA